MKHLKKFFEEVNPRDIALMQEKFDDYFTISFEFEIETDDRTHMKYDFQDFDPDDTLEIVIRDFKIKEDSDEYDLVLGLIDDVQYYEENDMLTPTYFEEIFDIEKYKSDYQKEIVRHLRGTILSEVMQEDYKYLEKMVKTHLANFYKKWKSRIEFVGDATLNRGIEIKPKTYLNSISEAIEIINDFYNDFDKQEYWSFSTRTGLHINIGTHEKSEWNPIKGLLLLNDFKRDESIPFVFKDMTWRFNNKYCGSLIPYITEIAQKAKRSRAGRKIKSEYELIKSIDLHDLEKSEKTLNEYLDKKIFEIGFKNLGFNITKLSDNYVEFRYAGGVIPRNVLIEKVKYFSFIIYTMTNKEYKKEEYHKKLYKFIDNL